MPSHWHKNPGFIHHQKNVDTALIREGVFGLEDGMVSTFGAITGIATATGSPFTVILSGSIIIAVECISMAVGSYLSSKSERAIDERKLHEEKLELKQYPEEECQELAQMYVKDGWPEHLSRQMAEVASKNKLLFLKEMAYRELKVFPENLESPLRNALTMGATYIVGGLIPLAPYFFVPLQSAIFLSILISLLGLFILGAATTKFSKRPWWQAGLEMLLLAAMAAGVGYGVGQLVA